MRWNLWGMNEVTLLGLAFLQNTTFSIMSRARNRDNAIYHGFAAVLSNLVWFLTFRNLITLELHWSTLPFYITGATAGSLWGSKVSAVIETKFTQQ